MEEGGNLSLVGRNDRPGDVLPLQSSMNRTKYANESLTVRCFSSSYNKPKPDHLSRLRSSILPWHGRVLWNVGLLLKSDPFPEEAILMEQIATASSGAEIDDAYFQYGKSRGVARRLIPRYLGVTPRPSRAFGYYQKLKARRSAPLRCAAI